MLHCYMYIHFKFEPGNPKIGPGILCSELRIWPQYQYEFHLDFDASPPFLACAFQGQYMGTTRHDHPGILCHSGPALCDQVALTEDSSPSSSAQCFPYLRDQKKSLISSKIAIAKIWHIIIITSVLSLGVIWRDIPPFFEKSDSKHKDMRCSICNHEDIYDAATIVILATRLGGWSILWWIVASTILGTCTWLCPDMGSSNTRKKYIEIAFQLSFYSP